MKADFQLEVIIADGGRLVYTQPHLIIVLLLHLEFELSLLHAPLTTDVEYNDDQHDQYDHSEDKRQYVGCDCVWRLHRCNK